MKAPASRPPQVHAAARSAAARYYGPLHGSFGRFDDLAPRPSPSPALPLKYTCLPAACQREPATIPRRGSQGQPQGALRGAPSLGENGVAMYGGFALLFVPGGCRPPLAWRHNAADHPPSTPEQPAPRPLPRPPRGSSQAAQMRPRANRVSSRARQNLSTR